MDYCKTVQEQLGGFVCDNIRRNEFLQKDQKQLKNTFIKTGTTICGVKFKDGVIIAADRRATGGVVVSNKDTPKVNQVAPNIYSSYAGTLADCYHLLEQVKANMELMRLNTGRQTRVSSVVSRLSDILFRYGGHLGGNYIFGGYDATGPVLCSLTSYGLVSYNDFIVMGSGTLPCTAIMETKYKDNMTYEEAKALVIEAIQAGIEHDLGSGQNVDVCAITKDGGKIERKLATKTYKKEYEKQVPYKFPKENTPYFRKLEVKFDKIDVSNKMDEEIEQIASSQ